jgi:hypothetical protein
VWEMWSDGDIGGSIDICSLLVYYALSGLICLTTNDTNGHEGELINRKWTRRELFNHELHEWTRREVN